MRVQLEDTLSTCSVILFYFSLPVNCFIGQREEVIVLFITERKTCGSRQQAEQSIATTLLDDNLERIPISRQYAEEAET